MCHQILHICVSASNRNGLWQCAKIESKCQQISTMVWPTSESSRGHYFPWSFFPDIIFFFFKFGSERGISIDADSGPLRYVLWCCGGICHQLLTFFKIGSGHTVGGPRIKFLAWVLDYVGEKRSSPIEDSEDGHTIVEICWHFDSIFAHCHKPFLLLALIQICNTRNQTLQVWI